MDDEEVRQVLRLWRLRRKRRNRFIICGCFVGVFLLFVGGTTYSLTSSDYPWDDGELAADIVIIVVALGLAVLAAGRARGFGRRADAFAAEMFPGGRSWLPPASDDDSGGVELEAQIPRLRTTTYRAVAWCVAWIGVLLLGAAAFVLLNVTGQQLLDRGNTVTATVVSVHDARRGTSTMTVSYPVGETKRTVTINRDSDLLYTPGHTLIVIYDPANPDLARTVGERNDNQLILWSGYILIIGACFGIPFSGIAARGWQLRYRAVRASGWRSGTAYVTQQRKALAAMTVEFHDGTEISLRAASSLRTPSSVGEFSDVPVWVGGEDQHMVVLLPRGRWNKGLHAVPVKAEGPRDEPAE